MALWTIIALLLLFVFSLVLIFYTYKLRSQIDEQELQLFKLQQLAELDRLNIASLSRENMVLREIRDRQGAKLLLSEIELMDLHSQLQDRDRAHGALLASYDTLTAEHDQLLRLNELLWQRATVLHEAQLDEIAMLELVRDHVSSILALVPKHILVALANTCPTCKASAGQPCVGKNDKPILSLHHARAGA